MIELMVICSLLVCVVVYMLITIKDLKRDLKELERDMSNKVSYMLFDAERDNRRNLDRNLNDIMEYFDLEFAEQRRKTYIKKKND